MRAEHWIYTIPLRLRSLFRSAQTDQELDDELRDHLERKTEEYIDKGMTAEQARRRARLDMGGVAQTKEKCRDARRVNWIQELIQDLHFGSRMSRKSPAFTAVAVLTLALGIGANSAMFSVIEAVILRALPYLDSSRLTLPTDADNGTNGGFLYKDFAPFKTQSRSFEDLAIYFRDSGYSRATLKVGNEPEEVQGAWVAANLFSLLGVGPKIGRVFTADEEAKHERVVILSHGLWVKYFASAADVLGKTLSINGDRFQIIGVMPKSFQFPARDQVFWAPITTNQYWGDPGLTNIDPRHSTGFYQRWHVIGRLRKGVALTHAQPETDTLLQRLAQNDPDAFRVRALRLIPLHIEISGNTRFALTVLFVAVCCVLLLACTNVANLVLARGAGREPEMAIRSALGARRSRIVRQLLTEGLLLGGIAAGLGLGLAFAGIRLLIGFAPADIPRLEQAGINPPVLAFTFVLAMAATILFSLGPALHSAGSDAQDALGTITRSATASRGLRRARNCLVVAEFAIALVLLSGSGLLFRSLLAAESLDPGFEPRHVLALRMTVPGAPPGTLAPLHERLLERLTTLPGVECVGAVNDLFEPSQPNRLGLRAIEGRSVDSEKQWTALTWKSVSGDFFQAIGATLLKGRYFDDQDTATSPLVVIIDESMAHRYWPNRDPIGAHIKGQDPRGHNDEWLTIIGVVHDMRRSGLENAPTPHVFEWYRQSGVDRTENFVIRTTADPTALATSLRATAREEASSAILSNVNTIAELLSEQLAPRRFQTWLLGLFAALALLLASFGIYAVMHYSVAQRTHEIGIRVALGACSTDIFRLIAQEGLRLALIGSGIGAIGALVLARFMTSLLFGVRATDPFTFVTVITGLLAVALVGCYIPARRAMQVDPMNALRYQ